MILIRHQSKFLVLCSINLLMVSFYLGCHRTKVPGTQENKVSMDQPKKLKCAPINKSSTDLNQDCLIEIMKRLPLKEVLAVLSPSNPVLHAIIKKRITGVWPSWFISEIENEASIEGSDARFVKAYLGFLKVISQLETLSKLPYEIRSKALDTILPLSLLTQESSKKDEKIYVGLIGDQVVAHLNLNTKNLRVIDLQSGKTLASQEFPAIANAYQFMDRILFEKLGPKSFLLTIQYQSTSLQIQEHLTQWSWEDSPKLTLIKTLPSVPMNAEINSQRKTVFRVTDTSFATFRRGFLSDVKVIDLWEVGADMPSKSVNMISCFSKDHKVEESLIVTRDKQCLQELAKNGLPIASDAFYLENGWGFGYKIDEKMLLISDWDQVRISSLDYKVHFTLLKAYCGQVSEKIGSISFMTKNGDIVFKLKHGFGYTNLWKLVRKGLGNTD